MRVAVLGLGSIGSRHAHNLIELGHEVVGYDPCPASEPEAWERVADTEAALARADAVVVSTPSATHAENALAALERGLPTLVEKPLAVEPEDARRIARAARQHGVLCGVGMNLRFHPAVRRLRALVQGGELGPIRLAHVWAGSDLRQWRPGVDYRTTYSAQAALGGGVVRDSIHELDYVNWLLGPAASVSAEAARLSDLEIDVEDSAGALIRMRNGALVSISVSYAEPIYRRGCMLVGARASARWDWGAGTITVERPGADRQEIDVSGDVADTYVDELIDFFEALADRRAACTSADDGEQSVRLADAVLRAARSGRRISL